MRRAPAARPVFALLCSSLSLSRFMTERHGLDYSNQITYHNYYE